MARLSPGRVLMVKAVPTSRPARWNGRKPTEPASRARLSEMMEVGASLNPARSAAGGFATEFATTVTVMLIGSPLGSGRFPDVRLLAGQDGMARGLLPIAFPSISHS